MIRVFEHKQDGILITSLALYMQANCNGSENCDVIDFRFLSTKHSLHFNTTDVYATGLRSLLLVTLAFSGIAWDNIR